jgi:hypothetical protein
MDLSSLKEKLRSLAPLELLKKLKEVLLALWSSLFSLAKGITGRFSGGRSGSSGEAREDGASPWASKKRLILFGLVGAAVLLFGLLITVIVRNARPEGTVVSNIASGLSIPSEDLFFPPEPDFLPEFLPEKEPRRFWTLDDIRQYWKAPGNSGWWMEEIKSTVDNLMEGVP